MDKKKFFILLSAVLAAPAIALAAVTSIQSLVVAITGTVLWSIFGAVVVFSFLYSAILFLTAGGDSSKLEKARSSFFWGIAGVVVGIMAWSAINFVGSTLLGG